ncbi:MAG: hypothetical protein KKF41_08170 [Actinobacteria bacterium]|nr:hypothetical protein [Actinomycetota bacterium]MBU1943538.1 hypothetical protein [Actinomycetota bacterium]MBU2687547.1 hypothetical protein [Actinomycetota bacterium]
MKNAIKVKADRVVGEIDPRIYGHFVENMARCIYDGLLRNERPGKPSGPWKLREEVVGWFRDLKPPVVRWPGGLYADGYNWRDGIGPLEARPMRRNRYWSRYGPATRVMDPNAFGSDEFMRLSRQIGAEPYVNVNLGTGSANEAARWVEYMNGGAETVEGRRRSEYGHELTYGVRTWGIGNEMYGFWALGHMPAEEYARRYLEFVDAMEEVDSDLELVAVGADHYFSNTWNREVLSTAGDRVGLLSIHCYLPGMERIGGVALTRLLKGGPGLYSAIVAAPLEFERRLGEAVQDIKAVMGERAEVRIAFDEWNLWWTPWQVQVPRWTLRDALFACGVFHALHRMSNWVSMANVAQLVNVLGLILTMGDRAVRTAMYYPFVLYSLAGPTRVQSTCECGSFDSPGAGGIPPISSVPYLDVSATLSGDGKALTVFVINRHPGEPVDCSLAIDGFSPAGTVEEHVLDGPSTTALNWFADEKVGITVSRRETGQVTPRCAFPAHSATALVFKKKAPPRKAAKKKATEKPAEE